MPILMKNTPSMRSRKGRISASTWCRKCVSPSSMPAMKAPRVSDRPAAMDRPAAASASDSTVSMNSSSEWVSATQCRMRGNSLRPSTASVTNTSRASSRVMPSRVPREPPSFSSSGSSTRKGTAAMSWNSSTAVAAWPCTVRSSPCSPSCLSAMAVEDMAKAPPRITAKAGDTPARMKPPANTAVVSTIWLPPSPSTRRRAASRRGRENSRPMVNISSTTPTSASTRIAPVSPSRPSPQGPNANPASR